MVLVVAAGKASKMSQWHLAELIVGFCMLVPLGCKGRAPEKSALLQAAEGGGTVADVYLRLVTLEFTDIGNWDRDWPKVRLVLEGAPNAGAPSCSDTPTQMEIFWALVFGDLRGGVWEERLPYVYMADTRVDLLMAVDYVTGLYGFDSRCVWDMIRDLKGHPALTDMWATLVLDLETEDARRPSPPGGLRAPVKRRRGPGYYKVPDWSYLDPTEVRELVTREPSCFASKWEFSYLLEHDVRDWHHVAAELREWLIKQGVVAVRPFLEDLKAGQLTSKEFCEKVRYDFVRMEDVLLAEYVAAGAQGEYAGAVASWLEFRASKRFRPGYGSPGFDPLGRIAADLPGWLERFPRLRAVELPPP